ncbi:cytochrome, DM13 and DOMON domain-containing protein [Sesamum angolense]|uniref:Cytochrome, DM13 and DOMON domain-containing protein n=1 Tax=Sesamum angolense TaxID=2727404 RepID=A0AAE1WXZ0_9LAMI|nr:cytochrome, DM13 and DOMON domain-containing protein [Sesamum angolense]
MGNMVVIWAIGLIKPPDSLRPFYLPQNHGGTYGQLRLNISARVNDCLGPLDAQDKEDQDLVIADKKEPLVISTGPALHYPNPPNPSKVLYINKKEAPILRVERGVPVKFSIQAGHDVALYVTSDPIGGNATLRNTSETIYFGGPEAEGVQASPGEMVWAPDRNTPDLVYYHSLYVPKMGWKVQVVDGGLPDMYNNSVSLDDQQVMLFWTLSENSISIAARGEKKSGYLAIGFGRGMVNNYAYVGWVDDSGKGRVNTYWIDGRDASNVHPTKENLTYVRCKSENGIITLEFTRPLNPSCDPDGRPECNNIVEPSTPLKVIWAMGAQWSDDHLSVGNMHFVTSKRPMSVLLMRGSAEAEEDLRPVLGVHGFMMFLAWGILLPGGILAARYLKHVKDDNWFRIHVYLQYSGLAIVFLGFLFAVAELRGLTFDSMHVKFGMLAILLAVAQPLNAYLRPKKPANGRRLLKETHMGVYSYYNWEICYSCWSCCSYQWDETFGREYHEMKKRRGRILGRSNWVLGNGEEEDVDLLTPSRVMTHKESQSSERMEIAIFQRFEISPLVMRYSSHVFGSGEQIVSDIDLVHSFCPSPLPFDSLPAAQSLVPTANVVTCTSLAAVLILIMIMLVSDFWLLLGDPEMVH